MKFLIISILLLAFLMLLLEAFFPRQRYNLIHSWWLRAMAMNACQLFISFVTGTYIDRYLSHFTIFNLNLPAYLQVILGYFVITFVYYWWHRLRHIGIFWDIFHQIHHSPSRLELLTAFYKHPLEIMADGLLTSFILYVLLGMSPALGTSVIAITAVAELFYHWNIKTPYWLGFIIQRPESHCIHHQRGRHHYNYSDLPIWDILFGTFYNPRETKFTCGFKQEKELKLGQMLLFKNVNGVVKNEK